MLIFSDGITEARDASGEEFGEERLGGLLRDLWNLPAMHVCEAILAQVAQFGRGCPQADDLTLIAARVSAGDALTES